MTAPPVLEIQDLNVIFGQSYTSVKALNHFSLKLEPGEIIGIVGESGSGKSTLAQTVMGLLADPPAKIEAEGIHFHTMRLSPENLSHWSHLRGQKMAMIFQNPSSAFNPLFTIETQMVEVLYQHGLFSRREAFLRCIDMLKHVDIPDPVRRIKCYPHEFSGGMLQRVMIAIALLTKPSLIIADEPTTALDVTTQAEVLHLLKKLIHEEQISMLFITHDLAVAASLCHRIVVLKEGNIQESGSTEKILKDPSHPYTQELLKAHMLKRPSPAIDTAKLPPLLTIENLSVLFPFKKHTKLWQKWRRTPRQDHYFHAIQNVTLTVYQGETLGIVGESGSGKSTLAKAILELIPFVAPSAQVEGSIVYHDAYDSSYLKHRRTQMVFQNPLGSLNPRMRVLDILRESFRTYRRKINFHQQYELIKTTLTQVGLSSIILSRFPHALSGGQQQRVAIARALLTEPKLLLLDEPTTSLDVTTQLQILDLLLELKKSQNLSYLLIAHDLSVVAYLADRIAVMQNGKIVEIGETQQICEAPKHPYTQQLLKAVPKI